MSARRQSEYDYIAHVQKTDNTVTELAGSMTEFTSKRVYAELLRKAADLGGWLLSQHITLRDDDEALSPFKTDDELSQDAKDIVDKVHTAGVVDESVASVFEDADIFGEYEDTYKGASLCTYKETGT